LAFNADNASSNNKQATELHKKNNSFDQSNRVRCFNHTIQLAAKNLLKPFTSCLTASPDDDEGDAIPDLEEFNDSDDDDSSEGSVGYDNEFEDDGDVSELERLGDTEREKILAETSVVRQTISKVNT
jgi:hypothetical protein